MGFFLSEHQEPQPTRKATTKAAAAQRRSSNERGCDVCALRSMWPRITSACMPMSGNTKDPDILVLGEAPSEEEDMQGKLFVDKAGALLRSLIPGLALERCAFTTMVRCRIHENRAPSADEMHACSVHLETDIAAFNFKAILGIGWAPLDMLCPGASINRYYGLKLPVKIGTSTLWYYPVYSPNYVLEQTKWKAEDSPAYPIFRADILKFFREINKWAKPHIDGDLTPQSVILPQTEE